MPIIIEARETVAVDIHHDNCVRCDQRLRWDGYDPLFTLDGVLMQGVCLDCTS